MPGIFRIPVDQWEQMRAEVERQAPEEACGLIAGQNGQPLAVIPVTNMLHSPIRYRMDPREQLAAFELIDRQGWELMGIYHSHPAGPEQPSPTDVTEAYYPEAVYLIWAPDRGEWNCRGFKMQNGQVKEITVQLERQD